MTQDEVKKMYGGYKAWTWLDAFMMIVLFIGGLMGVALFGFVLGVGMELARGLF